MKMCNRIYAISKKSQNSLSSVLLPPFHNVSHSNIAHMYIDVNEFRHRHMFRFIAIYMNVDNARMT